MIIKPAYSAYDIIDPSGFASTTTIGDVVSAVVPFILSISGVIVFVMLIYGGILYLTSAGDPKNVEKATKTITYSLIGLIVIVASYSIMRFIQTVFGLETVGI